MTILSGAVTLAQTRQFGATIKLHANYGTVKRTRDINDTQIGNKLYWHDLRVGEWLSEY